VVTPKRELTLRPPIALIANQVLPATAVRQVDEYEPPATSPDT
jgi:hypothetical protein